VIPKPIKYRNRKLLDIAHEIHECTIQIPDICQGYVPEGCEPVHANWGSWSGKGMGTKGHDFLWAAGCHSCHVEIDQGASLPRSSRVEYWRTAFIRTQIILWETGKVRLT